jgi:excinuclease ABC subunit B
LEYILDIKNPSSEKLHSHYKEILNLQQQLLDNHQIFDFDLEKVLTALEKSKKKKVYILFVSATPAEYEIQVSNNTVVEQIIRPTGLLDPITYIYPKS